MDKKFTVRDVETLLQEMAIHDYFLNKGSKGLKWSTESFERVLSNSEGSGMNDDTSELKLGDRFVIEDEKEDDEQLMFGFDKDTSNDNIIQKLKGVNFFE